MEIQRTAVVKLSVPDDRRDDLKRTMNTFRDAAQRFVDRGWEGDDDGYVITTRTQLQPLVYDEIREDTGLHSDLCVGAVNQAADALSTCVEKMKQGERTSKPEFTSNTTIYTTSAITYFDGYCSLAAYGNGRVHAEYVFPDESPQAKYMESNEWEKQGARLRYDQQSDTYYLHVSVTQEREDLSGEAENQTVLGVDRNVDGYLAVTSTGAFIGNADLLNHKRREYGIFVDTVQPAYTSQRCSHSECGFTHEDNRDGDEFKCLKCGKQLHADYNAARNIGWRLVQYWLKSSTGRADCQVALKSGIVNANGEYSPAGNSIGQSGSPLTSPLL